MCGGDPQDRERLLDVLKVFPACAGVILYTQILEGDLYGVPRVCGGDPHLMTIMYPKFIKIYK